MKQIIKSTSIVLLDQIFDGYIIIEDGIIKDITKSIKTNEKYIDYGNNYIMPGIFDTHNHGMNGYSLMVEGDFEDNINPEIIENKKNIIKKDALSLLSVGVTSTLLTMSSAAFYEAASILSQEKYRGATIRGINSEGPWLNRVGEKGVKGEVALPDMNIAKSMLKHSHGLLKLVGIAPELKGSQEVIDYFTSHGVKMAFTHTDQNYDEAMYSFSHGVSVSTHTGNVMSGIHHRDMGGLGACLLNDDVMCEVICDGMHVSNTMLELYFRVKDYDKFMMISDNVAYAGMPQGRYIGFGGNDRAFLNITKEGFVLSDSGRLSGSSQPVIFGIKNLFKNLNIPLYTILKMASYNPAHFYGFDNIGSIEEGKDADIIIVDHDFNVLNSYIKGELLYSKSDNENLVNMDFYNQTHVNQ